MAKAAIFKDPLRETAEYRLSEFFDEAEIPEDTTFEMYRLGSRRVRGYVASRGRADPDSMWGRWYRGELADVPCPQESGHKDDCICGGKGVIVELLAMSTDDCASLMAAATKRAHPLRVDVAENGDGPHFELWDTADHEDDRQELLETLYSDLPELSFMLMARCYEADLAWRKAYEATRKNWPTSSTRKRKRRGKSASKSNG